MLPAQVFASAKTEADKANACKNNGEGAAGSTAEDTATITMNNFNATGATELAMRERGGQILAVKGKMEEKLEAIKTRYADYESDPKARKSVKDLEKCIEDAGGAADTANKQAEDAKKANEEKGGGGGMPDLSSLLSALQKEKKQEEAKEAPLDCSNPTNGSNPVCMCQINPRASGCGNQESTQTTAATRKDRNSKGDAGDDSSLGSNFNNTSDRQASKPSSATPGLPGAGGSGSSGMGSSAAGGKTGNDATYGAPLGKAPGVIEGSYGGGGGGSRSASGYRMDTPLGRSAAMIQRKMASIGRAGAMKDGMTGPHTDLFMKVRTRYISVRSSLKP